jgi:two-component system, chemotaxis family, sensor kinase CheA
MRLTREQIRELREIFKSEAVEHVKSIAKVLIRLADSGTEDAIEPLGRAYREAHGLKGSATTVGLDRIAALAEKMEISLRHITQEQRRLSFDDVDLLLSALDAVRKALDEVDMESDEPTPATESDQKIIERLVAFVESDGWEKVTSAPKSPKPEKPSQITTVVQPSSHASSRSSPPNTAARSERPSVPHESGDLLESAVIQRHSGREMDLPADQIMYLVSVFQAEAAEHIKSLAETLFNLEDGKLEVAPLLISAFRDAHSLKGSAGTIGFDRVATVTHGLEDALGALQKKSDRITPEIVDVLLDALDVIRRSVKEAEIGDTRLSAKESNILATLREIVEKLEDGAAAPPMKIEVPSSRDIEDAPPSDHDAKSAPSAASKAASSADKTPSSQDKTDVSVHSREEFIRVSEDSVENLIAQIGELFEAHLHLLSISSDLKRIDFSAEEVSRLMSEWLEERESLTTTVAGPSPEAVVERIKGLKTQIAAVAKRFARDEREFSKLIQNSQEGLQKIRLAPVSTIFVMIRRQVREICRLTGKRVELFLDGGEYAVDRKVLEAIEDPLIHIIRNAVDHGIEDSKERVRAGKNERGKISVVARHIGDAVELIISDDGQGIDPAKIKNTILARKLLKKQELENLSKDQLYDFLFESGFSTQKDVSKISGRGVGLDVVKHTMESLGGEVRLSGEVGQGTVFTLRLPLSMSTLRCLLVKVSGRVMAIPASNVDKVILVQSDELRQVGGGDIVYYREQNIALMSLSDLLQLSTSIRTKHETRILVIVSFGERRVAFQIDDIIEYTQLILRPLGDLLERVSYISGISLLGTGEIALVLNPSDLVRASGGSVVRRNLMEASATEKPSARILVVDDSMATRTLEKTLLESAGYTVMTASDGYKALDVINSRKCDLIITDIQMPNMDGLSLTRVVKTQYRFLQLPVILVSSLGSDEDKARGLESGADAYIVKKDLSQKELVEIIEQLL